MPIGPFRTSTSRSTSAQLERFDDGAEVTPESLVERGLIKNTKTDVKILGNGELKKKLTVSRARASRRPRARRSRPPAARVKLAARRAEVEKKPKPKRRRKPRRAEAEPRRARRGRARRDGSARGGVDVLLARQRVARPGAAPARPLHGHDPRALPPRLVDARAGRRLQTDQRTTSTGGGGTILGLLNVFSGGALSRFSLFALGIMPYVTASIILQLMTVVVPKLEQLQKEGESGYAKINQYTRYLTVALAAAQSTGYAYLFKRAGHPRGEHRPDRPDRRHAHRRHDAADVDGRADHEARHRQRHLAADLRVDPRVGPDRHRRLVQRRHDGEAVLPAHRARRSSSRSSSSRRASAGSRSSTRSGWWADARPPAARPTCRCA